jgi:hypothetical protein
MHDYGGVVTCWSDQIQSSCTWKALIIGSMDLESAPGNKVCLAALKNRQSPMSLGRHYLVCNVLKYVMYSSERPLISGTDRHRQGVLRCTI